jgi:hypothetical protein
MTSVRAFAFAITFTGVLGGCERAPKPAATTSTAASATESGDRPLAKACIGPCPSFETAFQSIVGTDGMFPSCGDDGPPASVIVERGKCGGFRYVSTAAGFETITDWFDASGALVGELRSADTFPVYAYGRIPNCDPMMADEKFCRAADARGRDGFAPPWRTP